MKKHVLVAYWQPILIGYHSGHTALPLHLGLSAERFNSVVQALNIDIPPMPENIEGAVTVRAELMQMRESELEELEVLLHEYLNPNLPFGKEMVRVLASACMGSKHLWHDLGMPERPRLTELFRDYFPSLHALNVNNMRWKRFLYRQLCERGGDYVCRAPSCEQCSSYNECFDIKE